MGEKEHLEDLGIRGRTISKLITNRMISDYILVTLELEQWRDVMAM
jgi:hypothetical protein